MQTGQLDTAHRITDVEEAACLASFAVDGEGMPDGCLNTEAIECGAKNFVVVEPVDQRFAHRDLVGERSINYALVQIGGPQSPNFAAEGDVVAIVDFGKMVERAGLLGEWEDIFASVVLNPDETFFDIYVGSAIFSHGAQLHQVAIRLKFLDGEKHVQGANHVIDLGEYRMMAIDHGIRGGTLFGEVYYGFRFEGLNDRAQEQRAA